MEEHMREHSGTELEVVWGGNRKSSLTEFRQMLSGDLLAYLSLNFPLYGLVLRSGCYFAQNQPISQKFNSFVIDGPTHSLIEMRDDV